MARSLNSQCDFENGFLTCNLPKDAVLLVLKVKTKTRNHMLVEDMERSELKSFARRRNHKKMGNKFLENSLES